MALLRKPMIITVGAVIFLSHLLPCEGVMNHPLNNDTDSPMWMQCWRFDGESSDLHEMGMSMASCIKRRMYVGLVENVDQQRIDIGDGVTFEASADTALNQRDLFPLGEEPSSLRGLADAYSTFLSRRGMHWDLSHIYPGLAMRIGPTFTGSGVLEFIMEKRNDHYDRAVVGPGQQLIRRTILPHLLGFRMNLVQLLPLVFGAMVYAAKNAFVFSKITLIVSTLLTLKSLFVLQHLRTPATDFDHGGPGAESYSYAVGPRPKPFPATENLIFQMFASPPFRGVNDRLQEDILPDDILPTKHDEFRGFHGLSKIDRDRRNFQWQ